MIPSCPRRCLSILLLLWFPDVARAGPPATATEAIEAAIQQWNAGWKAKDAKLAAAAYSDDADWTNAFGFHKRGRAAIEAFLAEVFQLPFVMAASSDVAEQEIRLVSDDVALVRTRVERTGQLTPDGKPLGTRHTHHLRVFARRADKWLIVSHLISDARDPRSPEH